MKIKYINAIAAAAVMITAASCSDNNWKPGDDVDPSCMTVYFEPLSSYNVIVEPDDSRLLPITIGRAKTDDAATINIAVTEAPEGVIVPSEVSFDAGEESKTIYIDIENMPSKSSGNISLALPDDMTSPYGAGTPTLDFKVTVSGAWIPLADDVLISFSKNYENISTTLYVLDGTYQFKLPNFINSGLDFVFTVDNPGAGSLYVTPVRNYIDVHDAWGSDYPYDGWLLFDTANDTYPVWSIDGSYPDITAMEFETDYNYIDVSDGYMYIGPYFYFADGSGNYIDLYIYFTPKFNPFE